MSERHASLLRWLERVVGQHGLALSPASADASFRRYWRLCAGGQRLIAVDAPPRTENNEAFVRMARALREVGLNTPEILAHDQARGFLLVGDLGERHYADHLQPETADRLYGDAIGALVTLQAAGPCDGLPIYDAELLRRELAIFDEWLLGGLFEVVIDDAMRASLDSVYALLLDNALEQPQVFVHRDFHCRNLMLTEYANPGLLDFQDALLGPVSYDLVSLLKDCYIDWPSTRVETWAGSYVNLAVRSGILRSDQKSRFPRWFDLMGVQRHLKAAGIFCRLWLRDGRRDYLQHLPRTLCYIRGLDAKYPGLSPLTELLEVSVMPRLDRTVQAAND